MIVSELCIYPIKSCQGIKLQQAQVTPKGFAWDREMMLVNQQGKFLTQRQYPLLAKVKVELVHDAITLKTQDNSVEPLNFTPTLTGKEIEVEIWSDRTTAIDQGDRLAQWFHQVLQLESTKQCRLVRQSPQHSRPINQKYAVKGDESVSFADGYPFLLTATASLQELNARIHEMYQQPNQTIPMERFRPNIVVETTEPFIEDKWKSIQIGEVVFTVVKPCSRCIITTTDQQTGTRDETKEPLRSLGTFRQFAEQGVMFGENMTPQTTGSIRVGDSLKVLQFRGQSYSS
jgi:uncharacterized protein YcbX